MRLTAILVLALLLAGCKNSPEERRQPQPPATKKPVEPKTLTPECKDGT